MIKDIDSALDTVKKLKEAILDRQYFTGYPGKARIIAGCFALIGAGIMSLPFYPDQIRLRFDKTGNPRKPSLYISW